MVRMQISARSQFMVDRRIQQTLICSLRVTEFISEKDHQVEKTIDRHKISSYP